MLNVRRGVRGMFARNAWAAGPQGAGSKDQPPRYSVWTVLHQPPRCPKDWARPMSDRLVTPGSQEPSLFGRVILIVQRRWVLAESLYSAFEVCSADQLDCCVGVDCPVRIRAGIHSDTCRLRG